MTITIKKKTKSEYENFLKILVARINLTNAADQDQNIYFSQFDIKKPEIYAHVIQDSNATK